MYSHLLSIIVIEYYCFLKVELGIFDGLPLSVLSKNMKLSIYGMVQAVSESMQEIKQINTIALMRVEWIYHHLFIQISLSLRFILHGA